MKKMLFIALTVISLSTILCSCQSENTRSSVIPQSSVEASRESVIEVSEKDSEKKIDDMLEENNFTGIAAAIKDNEIVYSKSLNKNNDGQEFNASTVFRIASDTKQFVAAAVMLLNEQGKLSVDDTLEKYFPEYSHAGEITIHHLLCMRSGLADYTNYFGRLGLSDNIEENKSSIMKFIFEEELVFTPNEQFMYCNSNYFLLAKIIEQVSDMTYEEYLTENIFKPLNMKSTGFYDSYAVEGAVIAEPFVKFDETDPFNKSGVTFGAGDIMSSADDLQKWLKVFEGDSILSDDSIKAMSTNYSGEDDLERYGYGWFIANDGIYHGGNLSQYSSVFFTSPTEKYSIIILSNENSDKLHPLMNNIRYELF